jgi:hypothetical protein
MLMPSFPLKSAQTALVSTQNRSNRNHFHSITAGFSGSAKWDPLSGGLATFTSCA